MASTNDITGASLVSKVPNAAYRENYDRIFGNTTEDVDSLEESTKETQSKDAGIIDYE